MTLAAIAYHEAQGFWTTPGGRPCTFLYREGTNDWNTLQSSLGATDEYRLGGRAFTGVAVDIGGYLGSVGISLAMDNPGLRVLIVEPVPDNIDIIQRNAALNNVEVEVFRGAIGPRGVSRSEIRYRYVGDSNLEHHAFVGNSSLAYPDGGSVPHDTLDVETLGLAELLSRFAIREPSLVKIDCEGGEWPFLETATQATLKRLPEIIGEAHPVMGHSSTDIERVLGKTHDVTMDGWLFHAVRK